LKRVKSLHVPIPPDAEKMSCNLLCMNNYITCNFDRIYANCFMLTCIDFLIVHYLELIIDIWVLFNPFYLFSITKR
jgi:hypothetical protein